jgi:hypothetical protein
VSQGGKRRKPARRRAPAPARERPSAPPADLLALLGLKGGGRGEPWSWVAYALLFGTLAGIGYLAARPGGRGPLWVFVHGRALVELAAVALLIGALAWCALKRPFLQRGRGRAFVCLLLVIGVNSCPVPYPSSREHRPSRVAFRLPVDGTWRVLWGGDDKEHNLLAAFDADRRFGTHLVLEVDGARVPPGKTAAHDYYAFGAPVLAPAAGLVARVSDDTPDTWPAPAPEGAPLYGNQVVIEVAEGEYVLLGHLMAGSVAVAVGQRVAAGDAVGRVGASGTLRATQGPHVAVHLQTTPDERWGEAIPWSFHGYETDGRVIESGVPRGGVALDGTLEGQLVRHVGPRD